VCVRQRTDTTPKPAAARAAETLPLGLVLVIEDERSIARLLDRILTRAGYAVLLAQTGAEALALAIERQPDVITLDLILPGLSGEQTLAALKANERTRAIPVIVISIRGDEPPEVPLPVYASLRKPLDHDAVLDAIAGALRNRQPGAANP
jgi:DNA-binding response OmpR family regulator